jgi:hypothetical protein
MTSRLREALHETATEVPAYELWEGTLTRARRRRRRTQVVTLVLLVAVVVLVPLGWPRPDAMTVSPIQKQQQPSLPDRVGAPRWGTATAEKNPAGRASVVFGATDWTPLGSKGELAVVGALDDTYRLVKSNDFLYAGEQALISPDGTKLAVPGSVLDLETGRRKAFPLIEADVVVPQAWSDEGRWIAVLAYRGIDEPVPAEVSLRLIDLVEGTDEFIAPLNPRTVVDGHTVAFTGNQFAYQDGTRITVLRRSLDTGRLFKVPGGFDAPAGARLAGKGAFLQGGTLALLSRRDCCAGDAFPVRWQVTLVHAYNGEPRDTKFPEIPGPAAVRLLGWSPWGEPVYAAFTPAAGTEPAGFERGAGTLGLSHQGLTDPDRVGSVEVRILGQDGRQRTVLAAAPGDMQSVDVADSVIISGRMRYGHPPSGLGPYVWEIAGAGVALLAVVIALVARRRLRRRP